MSITKQQLLRIKDLSEAVVVTRVAMATSTDTSLIAGKTHCDAVRFAEDQFNRYLRKLTKTKPVDDGIRFSFRTTYP